MAIYHKKGKKICGTLESHDFCSIEAKKHLYSGFADLSVMARYVCVFLLNKNKKKAFVYGPSGSDAAGFVAEKQACARHSAFIKQAFGGEEISYEWIKEGPPAVVYQTMLLPLKGDDGTVEDVLGIVKMLDSISGAAVSTAVAESPGQSFVRLVMNAREEEKRKISSALHDEIGTAAVVINSLLAILKEDIKEGKTNEALDNISQVSQAFEQSASRIKKVIVDLRPPQMGEIGLNSAVKNLVDSLTGTVPLNIKYAYKVRDNVRMSETVKITLYRVVQEAINNTLKHAKAKNISIAFREDANSILLEIKDDGVGYIPQPHASVNKLGILGMKENLSYIGGTIEISGKMGEGTLIKVTCPKITYVRNL